MDILKMQADLAKLQAETMRVFADVQKTNRFEQRWLTPLVAVSAVLAVGSGLAAVAVVFVDIFLR